MQTCTQAIWSLKSVRNDFLFVWLLRTARNTDKNLLTACQKETQTNQKSERARPNGIYQKQWLADNLQRAIVFPSILWYSITQISMFGRYIAMPERNMVNLTITMTREERKALKQLALDSCFWPPWCSCGVWKTKTYMRNLRRRIWVWTDACRSYYSVEQRRKNNTG